MRITKYKTELNADGLNVLVKESAFNYDMNACNEPCKVATLMNDCFRLNRQTEEYVYLLCLNTKMKIIGIFELSHGTVNMSLVSPREVFVKALLSGATNIILVHNHPSGDIYPSKEDIESFKRLKEVGNLVNIPLADSIIVGDGYLSMYEQKFT